MSEVSDATKILPGSEGPILEYQMSHNPCGLALIFQHNKFACDNLKRELQNLNLKVSLHTDFTLNEIKQEIRNAAAQSQEYDCIVIAIATDSERNKICAKDEQYELNDICELLSSEKLAGKPKIMIVQACQTPSRTIADSSSPRLSLDGKIPTYADFLIAYSTIPSIYGKDENVPRNSYFIQELCAELHDSGKVLDLVTLFTLVNQRVIAIHNSANIKGTSCVKLTSMLTSLVRFK